MKLSPHDIGFYLIFCLVLVLFFVVIKPYLLLFLLAFCTAVTIVPVYTWVNKKINRNGVSATITALLFLLGILVPLGTFTIIAIGQAESLGSSVQQFITDNPDQIIAWQQQIAAVVPMENIEKILENGTASVFSFLQNAVVPLAGSVVSTVINLIFFILLLAIFLVQKDTLVKGFSNTLPLDTRDADFITSSIVSTIGPIMRSTIIVAAIQALLGVFILALFGTPSLIFFFFALFFASFIPLGSGLIIVPIGLVYLLIGNVFAGVTILLWHTLVTSSSDNVIRSWLFRSGTTKLPELLTFIATLGGLSTFGIVGVVFGPLIGVVFIVLYRLYLEKKAQW